MARNIFIVNATQVNAQGQYSKVTGFPKNFDSDSYEGDVNKALRRAKAAYFDQLSKNYAVDDRPMQTVTLEQADGRVILRESEGGFPVIEPEEE